MCFEGGEDLTIPDILDAPGEVIGKSSYGTLYKANISRDNSILLLRFLRPACSGMIRELIHVVHVIGLVRHLIWSLLGHCISVQGTKVSGLPILCLWQSCLIY